MYNLPIRILHVQTVMDRGGAETFVMSLYRKIDREKVQFDFIVSSEEKGAYDDEIGQLGGQIIHCPTLKGYNIISYMRWWKRFLKESNYRVIHSHIRGTASIFLAIARKQGMYTICHSHSISNGKGLFSAVKYLFQLPVRYLSDSMIACSAQAGRWLFGKNVEKDPRYEIWNNGIDVQRFRYDPERRAETRAQLAVGDLFVIGHVGRFIEVKNHKFLIEVFKQLHETQPESILLLVGDGPLRGEIENLVATVGLQKSVRFLGVREDIPSLLDAMDCFVLPSYFEGLGIAAIEAQTSGLPCFLSHTIPEEVTIAETTHFLPIDGGPAIWATALEQAIGQDLKRPEAFKQAIEYGFEIESTARYAEHFYIDKAEQQRIRQNRYDHRLI